MTEKVSSHLHELLLKVKNDQIDDFTIDLSTNKVGEGFVADLIFVTLTKKNTLEKEFLVIKQQKNAEGKSLDWSNLNFVNEMYFYDSIWPSLHNFYTETTGKHLSFIPKCFGTSKTGVKMIAMEDVKNAGFDIYTSGKPLDEDHLKMTFKTFGIFHGVSMAFKERNCDEFLRFTNGVINEWRNQFTGEDLISKAVIKTVRAVQSLFDPVNEKKLIENLVKYEEKSIKIVHDVFNRDSVPRVITHGDSWTNNFMYRNDVSIQHCIKY